MDDSVGIQLPERADKEIIAAIFRAWDHYGPGAQPRLLGSPEAERIYKEIRAVATSRR